MASRPTISVIIPTLDAEAWIETLLDMLSRQSAVLDEILVVDSGSRDRTRDIARRYSVTLIQIPHGTFDHGGTRTLAARKARGEVLFYFTQDAIPTDTHVLQRLLAAFADQRVAAAYGRQLPAANATPFAAHLRLFNYPAHSQIRCWSDRKRYGFRTIFISNSFAAYRRDVLAEIGYFAEEQLFGEDTLAVAKILEKGYCVAYAGDACVHHSHNYTFMQDCRRYFDIGAFHALHPELVQRFGTTGGAGRDYVFSEIRYLIQRRLLHLLPLSMARNAGKLAAYHLGRHQKWLPVAWKQRLSMSPHWWSPGKQA